MAADKPQGRVMTTAAGVPVADNQNSLTARSRGPVLADYQLRQLCTSDEFMQSCLRGIDA